VVRRIAIVNRGEAAMRLVRAVRELGGEVATIALYTEPDRRSLFVREADEAIELGPSPLRTPYLDLGCLERALLDARADTAWVGWGFVAEEARFAELCERLGVVFVGPSAAAMRQLGDKIAAKRLAEEAGLIVVPWSGGPVASPDEAALHAARLGFPLMIKAAAGGGGRGMRLVRDPSELAGALAGARNEAEAAFGDPTVFLERLVTGARHVEVQIIGDRHGTLWSVGVRDCTIQRRHQKVVEEAPSPALSPAEDRALREAAASLGRRAGYHGAGTVEFLFDPIHRTALFMEVNARLQVEHPVTEATTGLDLVKLQLHVAGGGRLLGEAPEPRGHAIEVRLCAEDPDNGFAPAPGRIALFRLPSGPGIRVDTGVSEGDEVPPAFDSLIAKLIASGGDRDEAVARLHRALGETAVVVEGGASNKAFLLALLERPEVRAGTVETGWLDDLAARGEHVRHAHGDVALLAAAVEAYEAAFAVEQAQFLAAAARGRPRVPDQVGHTVTLRHRGLEYHLDVRNVGPGDYRIDTPDGRLDVHLDRLGRFEYRLTGPSGRFRVLCVARGLDYLLEVDGVPHRVSRDDGGVVRAPMPAIVLSIAVQPGETVAAGDRVAVLESMKMELVVAAPCAGRVAAVLVQPNQHVIAGMPLLALEMAAAGEAMPGRPIGFGFPAVADGGDDARERWNRARQGVRHLLLGFDVDRAEARRLATLWDEAARALPPDDAALLDGEDAVLDTFADLQALFRRQRADDDPDRAAEEYLFTYLRAPDAGGAGLPDTFLTRLRRVLARYGVTGLDRTPALDAALLRIARAHDRADEQLPIVLGALDRRLAARGALAARLGDDFRARLDRLIAAGHGRFQALADLARECQYRYFDEPLFARARAAVYEEAETTVTRLAGLASPAERAPLVARLVDCPQPLVGVFLARVVGADPATLRVMLEALTRRYYRIRALESVRCPVDADPPYAAAEYDHEGRRIHVVTTFATSPTLAAALGRLHDPIARVPAEHDVVVDCYVAGAVAGSSPDERARTLLTMLAASGFPRPVDRIVFAVADAASGHGMGGMQHFTFRPVAGVWAEDRRYRGLHPMMGKRMHLWRLEQFDIERLPTVEDVYLFRGVARENRKDERLLAIAEVRDLTPVRDERGAVVRLPHLERMLLEALAAIRLVQARRPTGERLQWNRVLLYVWPPLDMQREELNGIIRRLAPATQGLGLEQVLVRARLRDPADGELRDGVIRVSTTGDELVITVGEPPTQPLQPLAEYEQKVVSLRRRGLTYPYELVRLLAPGHVGDAAGIPPGEFIEYDLDGAGDLAPVDRPRGQNRANVVVGVVRSITPEIPEGMSRVILLGDPSREMGSLAEAECRRINAALDLAERMQVPLEWFALSAGAKISMESGTENMDWISRVLRRLIEFTQAGGEVNVVVCGINVGAQPYWNAEATMLMHTRGILVMVPDGAMVLTGKQALEYSGGVSAEDNLGIGGYDRIMGPNGQAQYLATDLADACRILLRHYAHAYVVPGERFPRRAATTDPIDRDVRDTAHGGTFATVGDVFADATNPGRKLPFDVRTVMGAVVDRDHPPLERWHDMRDAEIAVVWDARVGGHAVCLIGFESHPLPRLGFVPADGPEHWTAGTLFPRGSKKIARAVNAASGNRPLVVLANLSGFDGSPESMRAWQLEYGAEIGRAVVNFRGPVVFVVISRYHGGAFVVFSKALNERIEAAAVEGSYASVIGGAPAAAVVFAREVDTRTRQDARVHELEQALAAAAGEHKARLRVQLAELTTTVRAEKLGQVADEFDRVHSVERALRMGSLDHIIPAARLRPYVIDAVERGMAVDSD
jgi:acetyl/propionyl-CoA carboxylase alpha subunit/acetyl-CoA carboxylase carboxyltransferase component